MKIAIHQPEFAPWLGFFHKMKNVDMYVVFDHVQYKRRYFENRNYIRTKSNGKEFITVPVMTKGKLTQPINEVIIDNNYIPSKLTRKITCNYGETALTAELSNILHTKHTRLVDLNLDIINWIKDKLNINTPMVMSSELNVHEYNSSELILAICKRVGATSYLCGPSGKDYLDIESFDKSGIAIEWQNFVHPVYTPEKNHIPYLSTIDPILQNILPDLN